MIQRYRDSGPAAVPWVGFAPGFVIIALLALPNCTCEDKARSVVDRRADRISVRDAGKSLSSRPTEFEPNDTPESASPIELKSELRKVTGTLSDSSDVDWFAITTAADIDEVVELTVQPVDGLDLSIHLEVPGGQLTPLRYHLGASGEAESIPALRISPTKPTRFALRAEGDTSGAYSIQFVRHLLGVRIEAEPNDAPSVAERLDLPGEIQGVFDRPGDRDVFELKTTSEQEGAVYMLEYTPASNVEQKVRVYEDRELARPLLELSVAGGKKGRTVRIPNFAFPNADSGSDDPDTEDRLWVVLTSDRGFDRSSPYTLRFITLREVADDIELEPNDGRAQPIGVPSRTKGFFHSPDDVDVFLLGGNVDDDEPETAPAESTESQNLPDVGVEEDAGDPDAGQLYEAQSLWDEIPERQGAEPRLTVRLKSVRDGVEAGLTWSGPDGEVEYRPTDGLVQICAKPYSLGEIELAVEPIRVPDVEQGEPVVDYILEVEEESSQDFELEPNDSLESAERLQGIRRGYFSSADDIDVWAFAIEKELEGQTESVQVAIDAPKLKFEARLLDRDGGLISKSSSVPGNVQLIDVDLPPGIYFVELRAMESGGCESYSVELKASP